MPPREDAIHDNIVEGGQIESLSQHIAAVERRARVSLACAGHELRRKIEAAVGDPAEPSRVHVTLETRKSAAEIK